MDRAPPAPLVGRVREREAIAAALQSLGGRAEQIIAIEGDPGIGKSRLLAHVAQHAAADGYSVLSARASEFEADLPYALWTEALDRHLTTLGDRGVSRLGLADAGALAPALPALAGLTGQSVHGDRHRIHRALRDLLERLATPRPVVICLDDLQWTDPASRDALIALVRRPPSVSVLLALAVRTGQLAPPLVAALTDGLLEGRVLPLVLDPLSEAEAVKLVGTSAARIYEESGGNPFYLEQLARVRDASRDAAASLADEVIPHAVASALAAEIATLAPSARLMVDSAAVAGDPFEVWLATDVAQISRAAALSAIDDLLQRALLYPAETPGRFAFRHPLVRHAVYAATPPGWRLGAHARAAHALERRGGGLAQRAHHVERGAESGDVAAVALLTEAASELNASAPATAARFYAAALRLLPDHPSQRERQTRMQARLADAQAAAGDPTAARATRLDALRTASASEQLPLIVAVADAERWLGRNGDARSQLNRGLAKLPAYPSPDRVRLRLSLALTAMLDCKLGEAENEAHEALADARALDDAVHEAAVLSLRALVHVSQAKGPEAAASLDECGAAVERLTGQQLATRVPALWMLGRAHRVCGRFEAALTHLEHGSSIAQETGRESVQVLIAVESVAPLVELGRLADAIAAAEDGVDRARLSGNTQWLLWAQCALSSALLATGDVAAALHQAARAEQLETQADFLAAGQPGWCLGAALIAAGNPQRGVAVMLRAFGGPGLTSLLPAERPAAAATLIEAQLARGDLGAAEEVQIRADVAASRDTGWTAMIAGTARSNLLLACARPHDALAAATSAREASADAALAHARASVAQGRALVATGQRRAAIDTLAAAESALDQFGARRLRDEAARELRHLGHRVLRPARTPGPGALAALTAREHEIAQLVAAGHTNREIAAQLVLSPRTIDAHLRRIYAKLGLRSRIELARELR